MSNQNTRLPEDQIIKPSFETISSRLEAIEASLADIKGCLWRVPTGWQLFTAITVSTIVIWGVSAAIALAFLIAAEGDMR